MIEIFLLFIFFYLIVHFIIIYKICPISFTNNDTEYKFINNNSNKLLIIFPGNGETDEYYKKITNNYDLLILNYKSNLFCPYIMINYSYKIINKYINNYDKIIIYGYSLGGLFATNIAYKLNLKNIILIVDKSFLNLSQIIGDIIGVYSYFSYLLVYQWCIVNNRIIDKVNCKKYVINSEEDNIIPFNLSLYKYCKNNPNIECIKSKSNHSSELKTILSWI